MSKALGFIIFIFFALVGLNLLINLAKFVIPPLPASVQSAGLAFDQDASPSINFNLFAQNGGGKSYITQNYGKTPFSYLYPNDWHDGIDIAAMYGAPVYSPNAGTVIATGNQDNYCYKHGFGKFVAVRDSAHNLVLWYAHLGTINIQSGETIDTGTEIGTIGTTGLETGTHLHLSIFDGSTFRMQVRDGCGPEPTGRDLNPLNYLGSVYN